MSRIVALWNRDGAPAGREILQQMVARLRPEGADAPRLWLNGSAGLAYQCLQTTRDPDDLQPVGFDCELGVSFDGRLDNRDELLELLGDVPRDADPVSDASLVLGCYRRFGESFAAHLNGDFAVAVYDGAKRRVLLARDPVGMRPLYFWTSPRTVIGASEIKAILAHPQVESRPDDVTLADVLVGGDPHELRRTCFQNIYSVMPGFTVVVSRDGVREFRHWGFDPMKQTRLSSVGEYAEALRLLFEQAVRRRLRPAGPAAVMVSGGLDSSAVLCQAEKFWRAGLAPAQAVGISQVFPDGADADEKSYLLDIERDYGLAIRRLPFSSFRFVDDPRWLWHTEFPRMNLDANFTLMATAQDLGCTSLIDGDYGDYIVSSDAYLWDLAVSLQWRELRRRYRALACSMTDYSPSVLKRALLWRFMRELAPEWMMPPIRQIRRLWDRREGVNWYTKSLRALAHQRGMAQRRPEGPFASKQAEICFRYFRSAYFMGPLEEMNKTAAVFGLEKSSPFLDRDLVQFMMSVPAEVVNLGGTYKGLFREAMRNTLPESIRRRFWKADFTRLNTEAADVSSANAPSYFSDGLAVKRGYVDRATFSAAFASHRSRLDDRGIHGSISVNSAIALELWLRAFWDPQTTVGTQRSALESILPVSSELGDSETPMRTRVAVASL